MASTTVESSVAAAAERRAAVFVYYEKKHGWPYDATTQIPDTVIAEIYKLLGLTQATVSVMLDGRNIDQGSMPSAAEVLDGLPGRIR